MKQEFAERIGVLLEDYAVSLPRFSREEMPQGEFAALTAIWNSVKTCIRANRKAPMSAVFEGDGKRIIFSIPDTYTGQFKRL